jgi:hypothetical protein
MIFVDSSAAGFPNDILRLSKNLWDIPLPRDQLKSLSNSNRYSRRHSLTGQLSQCGSKIMRFFVLDIQSHVAL